MLACNSRFRSDTVLAAAHLAIRGGGAALDELGQMQAEGLHVGLQGRVGVQQQVLEAQRGAQAGQARVVHRARAQVVQPRGVQEPAASTCVTEVHVSFW